MSVKYGILALLTERSMYGHELKAHFEARTGSTWAVNIGQVYTTLARLQRDGLVAPGRPQADHSIVYDVTEAGRAAVSAWWHEPVEPAAPARDELAIKVALAASSPGIDVLEVIAAQRAISERTIQQYVWLRLAIPAEPSEEDLAWLIVLEHLSETAEAERRWLDRVEATLRTRRAPAIA